MDAIIKLSSMGDIIHSLVVLPKLNKKVAFVIDDTFKEIVQYNPYIEQIVPVYLRAAKKKKTLFLSEFMRVKNFHFERVYDLQGLFKSAVVSALLSNNRIGYQNPREKIASFFYTQKVFSKKEYAIQRYLELFGIDDTKYLLNHPKLLFYKERGFDILSKNRKNIVFIIGASWECKKLPRKKWIELANALRNENIIIPYVGEREKEDAFFIANACKNVTPITLNINDLKALIDKVDLLIGNDTGPSFIAWANNVKNIILYGCTYNNKILENSISKSVQIQQSINKKLNLMDKIKVKEILQKIEEL